MGVFMQLSRFSKILAIVAVPVILFTALQYNLRGNSGTIFVDKDVPQEVTFIIATTLPKKAKTTLKMARELHEKGIHTVVILEGAGVKQLDLPYIRESGYKGEIIACPKCMSHYGMLKKKLPDNVHAQDNDYTKLIHEYGNTSEWAH